MLDYLIIIRFCHMLMIVVPNKCIGFYVFIKRLSCVLFLIHSYSFDDCLCYCYHVLGTVLRCSREPGRDDLGPLRAYGLSGRNFT